MTALFEVPGTTAGETVAKQKRQFMLSSSVHVQSGFICVNFFEGQFCSVWEKSTNIFLSRCIHDRSTGTMTLFGESKDYAGDRL